MIPSFPPFLSFWSDGSSCNARDLCSSTLSGVIHSPSPSSDDESSCNGSSSSDMDSLTDSSGVKGGEIEPSASASSPTSSQVKEHPSTPSLLLERGSSGICATFEGGPCLQS